MISVYGLIVQFSVEYNRRLQPA